MEAFWWSPVKTQWLSVGGGTGVTADTVTVAGPEAASGTESEFSAGTDVGTLHCWDKTAADATEAAVVVVEIVEGTSP